MEYVPDNKKPTEDDIKNMPHYEGSYLQKNLQEKSKNKGNFEDSLESRSKDAIEIISSEIETIKSAASSANMEEKKDIDSSLASAKKQIVVIENRMRQADTDKDEIAWNTLEEERKGLQQQVSELESQKDNSITNIEIDGNGSPQVYFDGAKKEDFDVPPQQEDVLKKAILDNQSYGNKTNEELLGLYEKEKHKILVLGENAAASHVDIVSKIKDALNKRGVITSPAGESEKTIEPTEKSEGLSEEARKKIEDANAALAQLEDKQKEQPKQEVETAILDAKADFDRIEGNISYERKNGIIISKARQEEYNAAKKKYEDLVKESGLDTDLEEKLAKFEKEQTKSWFNQVAENFRDNNPTAAKVFDRFKSWRKKYPYALTALSFTAVAGAGFATGGLSLAATAVGIRASKMAIGVGAGIAGKYAGGVAHEIFKSGKYKKQHAELKGLESLLENKTKLSPSMMADYKKRLEKARGRIDRNKDYGKNRYKVAGALVGTGGFLVGSNWDSIANLIDGEAVPDGESIEDTEPNDADGIEDKDAEGSDNKENSTESNLTPEEIRVQKIEEFLSSYEPESKSLIQPGEGIYHSILRQTGSVKETMQILLDNEYVHYDSAGNLVEQVGVNDGMGAFYDQVEIPGVGKYVIEGVNGKPVYSACEGFFDACDITEIKGTAGSGDLISGSLEKQEYLMESRPKAPVKIPMNDPIIQDIVKEQGIAMPPVEPFVPDPKPVFETTKEIHYETLTDPEPVVHDAEPLLEPETPAEETPKERRARLRQERGGTVLGNFFRSGVGKVVKFGGGAAILDLLQGNGIDGFGLFKGGGSNAINIEIPTEPTGPTLDPSAGTDGPSLDGSR